MRALELSVKGFTQVEIATELRVTQAAVSKILNRVETRIFKDRIALIERQRTQQTLRLEHLYSEGMRAWERSKGETTRRRQRRVQDGRKQGPTVAELVVETEHGNPQFLELARKALADLRKLWGLNRPEMMNVEAPAPDPYADLSDEEVREHAWKVVETLLGSEVPMVGTLAQLEPRKAAFAAEVERRRQKAGGAERVLEMDRVSHATPPMATEPAPQDLAEAYAAELERRRRNGGGS
jgi:hypothetical protein